MSGQDMRKLMEKAFSENANNDYDYRMILDKFNSSPADKFQLIYEWVKTGVINLRQFKSLIHELNGQSLDETLGTADNPRIATTYEIITPESAEVGDAEEQGWIDEKGVDMTPDKYDIEDNLTAVDKAVEFLRDAGATEPSSSVFNTGVWYNAYDVDHDYTTNNTENRSYHLYGFTPEEETAIYQAL